MRQLSEQLRRFLDDQVWFENRRVIDILRSIEARALELRETARRPGHHGTRRALAGHPAAAGAPAVRAGAEGAPRQRTCGDADEETDPAALFEQVYVDPEPLRGGVRQALRGQPQVGLAELVRRYPLRQGVAELVTYLSLKDECVRASSTTSSTASRSAGGADGRERTATLPRVTYARRGG